MLKNCGGGPRPIRLCVEKTKNFDEIQQRLTCRQKWAKILIGPFSIISSTLSRGPALPAKKLWRGIGPIRLCVEKT